LNALTVLRFATRILPVIAFLLAVVSIALSAATYEPRLAGYILPLYPPYESAQEAVKILEDRKYSVPKDGGATISVGVLEIDHPSWPVMLDFLQSEIAIRKSERNEPEPPMFKPPASAEAPEPPKPIELPPIDFRRIKIIFSMEVPTIKAGSKPLSPPYKLVVLFPPTAARRVYEFLSFHEFWLNIRQMLVLEVRFASILVSGCSLLISVVLRLNSWCLHALPPPLWLIPL
jgi:hypothetical protein